VKRAALGAGIELEIVEEVIDDLAIVEADFREFPAADLDDLVNVALLSRVPVIDRRVTGVIGVRARDNLRAP
jgi:hypothetical protein